MLRTKSSYLCNNCLSLCGSFKISMQIFWHDSHQTRTKLVTGCNKKNATKVMPHKFNFLLVMPHAPFAAREPLEDCIKMLPSCPTWWVRKLEYLSINLHSPLVEKWMLTHGLSTLLQRVHRNLEEEAVNLE